jgi:hypothetical protein
MTLPRAHGPSTRGSTRRAFTLLEVVLAGVLGLLVIVGSLALFATMDRAKRLQAARLETNAEMALAHKVLQQAFRTLLMESSADPRDDDLKSHIEKDIDDAFSTEAGNRRADASIMRFAVQPDPSKRTSMGEVLQTIDITLSTPPIHAATRSSDAVAQEDAQLRQLALERLRTVDIWNQNNPPPAYGARDRAGSGKSPGPASDRESSRTLSRGDRLRMASGGLTGAEASPDRIAQLASREIEPPRAPGVRGVFELRPEDDSKVLARMDGSGRTAWALWWKQIPFNDALPVPSPTASPADRARDLELIELARAGSSDGPEIKLLSGLNAAHWQVYRRRKMVMKMAASRAKELPAYVEFKFETIDGRREDWLFEVAWSYGQEPGTVLAVNDPLGAPGDGNDPDSIAAAVQAALNAANGGKPGGGPNGAGGTGPVAAAGGTKPTTGSNGRSGSGSNGTGGSGGTPGGGATTIADNGDIIINLPGGGRIVIPANARPGGSH